MASVDFIGVSKSFAPGAAALRDLHLHVDDHELLVLVGPSGCGKSTVLRLLAGLEAPTQGTIRIRGEPVNDLTPRERNVAMVFQDYALYPFLSVRKNIEFPLKMRRLARQESQQRVDRVAELLGLEPLLDRLPKQLSGGQRQRVAMARALVRDPAVSLLDEPLSNLDAKLRAQVRAEIAELQRRTGTTMLYVTHDQVEAMTLGHRVAVLQQGVLRQVATPRELYARPANVFVASFLGNPPMNLRAISPRADGNAWTLPFAGRAWKLTDHLGSAVPIQATVTLGVRPEALRPDGADDEPGLAARVAYVEYLGHETLVHVDLVEDPSTRWVARVAGMHPLATGTTLTLRVRPTDIHLFDSEGTRMEVTLNPEPS